MGDPVNGDYKALFYELTKPIYNNNYYNYQIPEKDHGIFDHSSGGTSESGDCYFCCFTFSDYAGFMACILLPCCPCCFQLRNDKSSCTFCCMRNGCPCHEISCFCGCIPQCCCEIQDR